MPNKTKYRRNRNRNGNSNNSRNKKTRLEGKEQLPMEEFKCEIAKKFLEILIMIKLYHWKTTSYATHKATDELYEKFNKNIDSFVEILLGKTNSRINLPLQTTMQIINISTQEKFEEEIKTFKNYLVNLHNNPAIKEMSNTDLYNIRDSILGDLNQLLYLLSFK